MPHHRPSTSDDNISETIEMLGRLAHGDISMDVSRPLIGLGHSPDDIGGMSTDPLQSHSHSLGGQKMPAVAAAAGAEIMSVQDVQRILHSHLKQLENCLNSFSHDQKRIVHHLRMHRHADAQSHQHTSSHGVHSGSTSRFQSRKTEASAGKGGLMRQMSDQMAVRKPSMGSPKASTSQSALPGKTLSDGSPRSSYRRHVSADHIPRDTSPLRKAADAATAPPSAPAPSPPLPAIVSGHSIVRISETGRSSKDGMAPPVAPPDTAIVSTPTNSPPRIAVASSTPRSSSAMPITPAEIGGGPVPLPGGIESIPLDEEPEVPQRASNNWDEVKESEVPSPRLVKETSFHLTASSTLRTNGSDRPRKPLALQALELDAKSIVAASMPPSPTSPAAEERGSRTSRRISWTSRRGSNSTLRRVSDLSAEAQTRADEFQFDVQQVLKAIKGESADDDDTNESRRWKRTYAHHNRRNFIMRGLDHAIEIIAGDANKRKSTCYAFYTMLCGLAILVDAAMIGVETDYIAMHGGDTTPTFMTLGYAFNCWYALEIAIRIFTRGIDYFLGNDWVWNWFDICLLAAALVDLIVHLTAAPRVSIGRVFRIVRLFRAVRVLRLVRWLQWLREFQKLVLCLASSLQTLLCSIALLTFVIFVFSIFFTQSLPIYMEDGRAVPAWEATYSDAEVRDAFGSVSKSMVSLYQAVTAGRNWGELSTMLQEVNPWLFVSFLLYLAVVIFGLLNVVTAVFVESAMRATQHYRDLLVHEKLLRERINAQHLRDIFQSIDTDNSGSVSYKEMESFLSDDSLKLQEYFQALELNASDTQSLFLLLDRDGSGEVDIDEFCDGCMRLGGSASSFDMNCMWFEMKRSHKEMLKLVQKMFLGLHALSRIQSHTKDRVNAQYGLLRDVLDVDPQSRRPSAASGVVSRRGTTSVLGSQSSQANLTLDSCRESVAEEEEEDDGEEPACSAPSEIAKVDGCEPQKKEPATTLPLPQRTCSSFFESSADETDVGNQGEA